jgi:hypothetical protein
MTPSLILAPRYASAASFTYHGYQQQKKNGSSMISWKRKRYDRSLLTELVYNQSSFIHGKGLLKAAEMRR